MIIVLLPGIGMLCKVAVKDCILLASGSRKKDLPYVAKVNSLWENPDDGKAR